MHYFWNFSRNNNIAILTHDGISLTYAQLGLLVDTFKDTFFSEKGIFLLECDGHYRQFVAYLAALSAGCPVLLGGKNFARKESSLSIKYFYQPIKDHFEMDEKIAPIEIHPDLAVLLSTSGSTGIAKYVRLSKNNIQSNAKSIIQYLEIDNTDRAPLALPFNYSYGMSIVNSHLLAHASIMLTPYSVIDTEFWDQFRGAGCTSLAGVPHSFELMERNQTETSSLQHLRYMTQAGGKLPPEKVDYWARRSASEGWRFFVMYGQTEASPRISFLPPEMALQNPDSIGISIPGGEITISDINGNLVPDGKEGELVYRGPNTMMGYARENADLAKGQDSDTLHTGDIAVRNPNGMFEIVGRKSRFVKPFGLRINIDTVAQRLQNEGCNAACGADGDVMYVLLASTTDNRRLHIEKIAQELSNWLKIPPDSFRVKQIEEIPLSPNGKIDGHAINTMIKSWVAEEHLAKEKTDSTPGKKNWPVQLLTVLGLRPTKTVNDVFQRQFPNQKFAPNASFVELGGDSLNYLATAIDLERILPNLPANWQNMSVHELESLNRSPINLFTRMDTSIFLRALSIILIVMGHLHFFEYGGGGAYTLFFVAGITFATFTIPKTISENSPLPLLLLIFRVGFLSICAFIVNLAVTGYGQLPAMFLYSNWVGPHVEGGVWFVEIYIQVLAFLFLLFRIPWSLKALRWNAFSSSLSFAATLVCVALLCDNYIDTNHLYRRLPHLLAWIFLTGVASHFAQSTFQRLVVSVLFFVAWVFFFKAHSYYFALSIFILIWVPSIPIPRLLSPFFNEIANASLFIYLTHFQFASLADKLIGQNVAYKVFVALLGGIILGKFYKPVDALLCKYFYALIPLGKRLARRICG